MSYPTLDPEEYPEGSLKRQEKERELEHQANDASDASEEEVRPNSDVPQSEWAKNSEENDPNGGRQA